MAHVAALVNGAVNGVTLLLCVSVFVHGAFLFMVIVTRSGWLKACEHYTGHPVADGVQTIDNSPKVMDWQQHRNRYNAVLTKITEGSEYGR